MIREEYTSLTCAVCEERFDTFQALHKDEVDSYQVKYCRDDDCPVTLVQRDKNAAANMLTLLYHHAKFGECKEAFTFAHNRKRKNAKTKS